MAERRTGAARADTAMPRRKDEVIKRIGVRISEEAQDRLRAESKRRGQERFSHVSLSELVNEAIMRQFPAPAIQIIQRKK